MVKLALLNFLQEKEKQLLRSAKSSVEIVIVLYKRYQLTKYTDIGIIFL